VNEARIQNLIFAAIDTENYYQYNGCIRNEGREREMALEDHLLLWNHAALKVLDVRHAAMQPGESLRAYRLPANAFVLSARGRAQLLIDGIEHAVNHGYVCHAGKGAFLDIVHVMEAFEYFMVFYKAVLPLPGRQELARLYKERNPFELQYGFAPSHPITLFMRVEQMMDQWRQDGNLQKFHVKALFHQFVYELYEQLQMQDGAAAEPDLVAQAIRYMEGRYAESVTLDDLASALHCNARQLQRLFKARQHKGPMEYLIQIRMQRAETMLLHTDAPLKQVAEAVGYTDSYYFSRMFKKYAGVSPSLFKEKARNADKRRANPSRLSRSPIAAGRVQRYHRVDDENHYQHKDGGVTPMHKSSRAMLAVSLMLSLMLLLGACTGAAGTNPGTGGGGTSQAASSQPTSTGNSTDASRSNTPVTIKHVKGELKLEHRPQKIAVLDTQFVDQLLALDELPAGSVITTGDSTPFPSYLNDRIKNVKVLGTKDEPNLEAVIAMDPDFIINRSKESLPE
jgi:iron complex transport system substrate-binding protein